jgi:hypothetical protein
MIDPLTNYLHDHLAGSVLAIELLESMRGEYKDEPMGQFAAALLVEVKADEVALRKLFERTGIGSDALKELSAWLAEKVTRLKLARSTPGELGSFEALEFLSLGVLGKLALWRALAVIAETDTRLYGLDFDRLSARAQEQHAQVENRRLEAARTAFSHHEE